MAKQKQLIVTTKPTVYRELTPIELITQAIEKNVAIDVMEKLLALQIQYEKRQAEKAFFESFGRFQSTVPDLVKNKQVSFTHKNTDPGKQPTKTEYKYQELGDIAKHIREPLADCGLSYRWDQQEDDKGNITVWCIVSHVGGHQERSQPLSGKYDNSGSKNLIQQKASTITYLRRYTLTGMLGLSTMEGDNDGKGGMSEPIASTTSTIINPSPSAEQFSAVMKKVVKGGIEAMEEAQKHFSFSEEQIQSLKIAGNIKEE